MIISTEQMDYLKELKAIDKDILSNQTDKKEAPGLIDKLDANVTKAQEKKNKANDKLEEEQMAQMQVEEDIKSANDRLNRANEKLQNISNDTEFKAANKEVKQLGAIIKTKTSELPLAVEQVKLAQEKLDLMEQQLSAALEKRKACPEDLNELFKALDEKIQGMSAKREAVVVNVEKNFLLAYEKAHSNRGGLALVAVEAGSCTACKVKIRPQLYNQILQGQLEECDTCKRLLFAN